MVASDICCSGLQGTVLYSKNVTNQKSDYIVHEYFYPPEAILQGIFHGAYLTYSVETYTPNHIPQRLNC